MDWILYIIAVFVLVTTFFLGYIVKSKKKHINKQSSSITNENILGKWISFSNPINIEEYLKPGDYVVLRIEYDFMNFDYKLAWIDSIKDGQVKVHILNKNISKIIKITDFCILPDYISNNFYRNYKKKRGRTGCYSVDYV